MTPCSLYYPTSHNSTSSTNRAILTETAPAPRPDPTRTPEPEGTSPAPDRNERDLSTIPTNPCKAAVERSARREDWDFLTRIGGPEAEIGVVTREGWV